MQHQLNALLLADIAGLFLLPLVLFGFAFWIWMIIDCAQHEGENGAKIAWLLAILLAGAVAAPVYFFVRKLPRYRPTHRRWTCPVYQPWRKDQRIDAANVP